jgi:hypothetical protein
MKKFENYSPLLAGLLLIPAGKEALYLDPGSGSFILQIIVAGAAGALFVMRNQIARLFGGGKKAKPATAKRAAPRKTASKKSTTKKKAAPKKSGAKKKTTTRNAKKK